MSWFSAFLYNRKGKRIGNEIADSMLVPRRLFHSAVVKGGLPYHLPVIASMHDDGHSLNEIRKNMIPYFAAGLDVLERSFGHQPSIDKAREVVTALVEGDDDLQMLIAGFQAMNSADPDQSMKDFERTLAAQNLEEDELEDTYEPPSETSGNMGVEVSSNNWEWCDGQIRRVIQYDDPGDDSSRQLQIYYKVSPGLVMPHQHLHFMLGHSLISGDGYLAASMNSADNSTGFFVVRASETEDGRATLFGPEPGDDPDKMREVLGTCAGLFSSGKDLTITLYAKDEIIMQLPIPGDSSFGNLFKDALESARGESGNIFDKPG